MTKGRNTKVTGKDGRRCSVPKCRKLAKDKIDGKYFCRIHSPMREHSILKETKKK